LVINKVFAEDEGEYICEAKNKFGRAETSAYLKIKGEFQLAIVAGPSLIDDTL